MKTCQEPQQTTPKHLPEYASIASGRLDGQLKWTILKEIMYPENIFVDIFYSSYQNKNKITTFIVLLYII